MKADGHSFPIWNTSRLQDIILAQYCPFKVIQNRLREQYGEEYCVLRHETWLISYIKALLSRSIYSQRYDEDNCNPQLCLLLKCYLQSSYVSAMIGNYPHLKNDSTITVFIKAHGNKPTSIEIGKKNLFRWIKRHKAGYDKYLDPIMNLEWAH